MSKLLYTTLDVFTKEKFLGNPLAIVKIPSTIHVSQEQKQLIAREFNFSETVFLHIIDSSDDNNDPIVVDIFTPFSELPFAGHPTIGSSWFLLNVLKKDVDRVTLRTKAGLIPAFRSQREGFVRLAIPTDFKIHESYAHPSIKDHWANVLSDADLVHGVTGPQPIASIVKGMSFVLAELNSETALSSLTRLPADITGTLPARHLGQWDGFLGMYAFHIRQDGIIRTRMFCEGFEDPATGSAAATLGGYLGVRTGKGRHEYEIWQGVEMKRKSVIRVIVEVGEDSGIGKIELEGSAVEVFEGSVTI